jgi:hypothetical protein
MITSAQINFFSKRTSIMSSHTSQNPESLASDNDKPREPLLITDAPADVADQVPQAHSVAVGSEGVQLDHLGPMVINSDGVAYQDPHIVRYSK